MAKDKRYDERRLLGLPTGHERPTGAVLVRLAKECGYKLRANASRKAALDAIANGKYSQRQLLQAAVRLEMGVPDDAPAKGTPAAKAKANGAGTSVADMRNAISSRKGYTGKVPRGAADVQALYDAIVGEGRIPHSYPTGTVLAEVIEKPWTMLTVTPDKGQRVTKVTLQAKSLQGDRVAGENIACKANRLGMLVDLGTVSEVEADVYEATVQLIAAE